MVFLWLMVPGEGWAGSSPETGEILVVVDDRQQRKVASPWMTLEIPSLPNRDVPVLDNGVDVADGYARDHLFVGRTEVPAGVDIVLWVTDGGPLGVGRILKRRNLKVKPGKTARVRIGQRPSPSAKVKTVVDRLESLKGSVDENESKRISEVDLGDSEGFTKITVKPWTAFRSLGLAFPCLMALMVVQRTRRAGRALVNETETLRTLLRP